MRWFYCRSDGECTEPVAHSSHLALSRILQSLARHVVPYVENGRERHQARLCLRREAADNEEWDGA